MTLLGTFIAYLAPLVYITNKEVIDEQLSNASQLLNDQTAQMKDLAGQHTANATSAIKGYAGDYTAKAQGMLGAKQANGPAKSEPPPAYQASDFPSAPKQTPEAAPAKAEPMAA